jgi:hypothetical protein
VRLRHIGVYHGPDVRDLEALSFRVVVSPQPARRNESVRAIILRSLAVALLGGLCVSFATTAVWTRVSYRYEPGLTQAEMQKLSELPPAQAEAELAGRRKPYSRGAWLMESLGQSYFWKYLAQRGIIPATGMFLACILVGVLTKNEVFRKPRR